MYTLFDHTHIAANARASANGWNVPPAATELIVFSVLAVHLHANISQHVLFSWHIERKQCYCHFLKNKLVGCAHVGHASKHPKFHEQSKHGVYRLQEELL